MDRFLPIVPPRDDPTGLPHVFRIESLRRQRLKNGLIRYDATIMNDPHNYPVHFESSEIVNLRAGDLVSIQWTVNWPIDDDDSLTIAGLTPATQPDAKTNLCRTILTRWVPARYLATNGAAMVDGLSPGFRHLFNAIFWPSGRFENYVRGPSSRGHHHNRPHGNLAHSLEVAELVLEMAQHSNQVDRDVLLIAALLHDAAKAEEYVLHADGGHGGWSEGGSLLGHRLMIYGWIVEAVAKHSTQISPRQLLALKHLLMATPGLPDWAGLPRPRMLEWEMLSAADRVSGGIDLFGQLVPEGGGFGRKHGTMKLPPFFSLPAQPVGEG